MVTECQHPEIIDITVCECGEPSYSCEDCEKCFCECHEKDQGLHDNNINEFMDELGIGAG